MLGRVAIVTGASSGIGRATALALARKGANLCLVARNPDTLELVEREIMLLGRQVLSVSADLTEQARAESLVEETLARFGRIDILVANVGMYVRGPVVQLRVADFEKALSANFYSALYPILATLPHMVAQRYGHLVVVSSMDGKKAIPGDAPYVAAKFALAGLSDVMRQELRDYNIHVTGVFPGRVDTPMISDLRVPWVSAKLRPERVARAIVRAIYRRQAEVIVPMQARGLVYLNTFSPRLADWVVRMLHLEGWENKE